MSQISSSAWSETAAANNSATPNGWPEGQTGASANDCAREMMSAIKVWYNRVSPTLTAGGTANALTLTYATSPITYQAGQTFAFYAGAASNTAATTIDINAMGVKSITRRDGSTALSAADIVANALYEISYDGTVFRLHRTGIT